MKRSFLVLPIVVAVGFLLFTQCNNFFGSDSDDDSVGGGGADFDPTLYYSKAEIHSLLPRCTGSGGLSDQLPLSSHRGGYSNGYPFDDVPEHCAYAIVSVTADHTPPRDASGSSVDVTIRAGVSDADSVGFLFPAGFRGSQTYIFPVTDPASYRIWAEQPNWADGDIVQTQIWVMHPWE